MTSASTIVPWVRDSCTATMAPYDEFVLPAWRSHAPNEDVDVNPWPHGRDKVTGTPRF